MKRSGINWLPSYNFPEGEMWFLWFDGMYVGNVFKEMNHWEANLPGNILYSEHNTSQQAAKQLIWLCKRDKK